MTDDAHSTLRVTCFSTFSVSGLESEWNALAWRLGALPFLGHPWASVWWETLRRQSRLTRDSLRLFVVRDAGGVLVAVAPMMLTERLVAGVALARTLQFIGVDPNITEVRGLLVAREDEGRVVAALSSAMLSRHEHDRVIWSGLAASGAGVSVLLVAAGDGAACMPATPMLVVTLPPSWDEFKRTLPRNTREALRKCRNSLARDEHVASLRIHTTPDTILPSLEVFFDLHSRRASFGDGAQHRDCFVTDDARAFLTHLIEQSAQIGTVRMFQLDIAGVIVAARVAFLYADGIYLYYSGYDPAWSRYSVMTTLVAEALKYSIEQGYRFANLSTGVDRSKMRWRPTETTFESIILTAGTPRARLAIRLEAMISGVRRVGDRLIPAWI